MTSKSPVLPVKSEEEGKGGKRWTAGEYGGVRRSGAVEGATGRVCEAVAVLLGVCWTS